MPATYKAIATVTVGSGGAANIEFTSIPATFTDLLVVLSLRAENSGSAGYSDSGTRLYAASFVGSTGTASTYGSAQVYIPNYAGSNNKSYSSESAAETNSTNNYLDMTAGLWSNTAAITSIKFIPSAGDFEQYSTATLYGIKNT